MCGWSALKNANLQPVVVDPDVCRMNITRQDTQLYGLSFDK